MALLQIDGIDGSVPWAETGSPSRIHGVPRSALPLALYVHIPFCVRKCYYCDFASGPAPEAIRDEYVEALCEEVRRSPWRGRPARIEIDPAKSQSAS